MGSGALKKNSRAEATPAIVIPSPIMDCGVSAGLQRHRCALVCADAVERHSSASYTVGELDPDRIVFCRIARCLAANPYAIRNHSSGRELEFEVVCRDCLRRGNYRATCVRISDGGATRRSRICNYAPASLTSSCLRGI